MEKFMFHFLRISSQSQFLKRFFSFGLTNNLFTKESWDLMVYTNLIQTLIQVDILLPCCVEIVEENPEAAALLVYLGFAPSFYLDYAAYFIYIFGHVPQRLQGNK